MARPNIEPTEPGTAIYPGLHGATNWFSPSYDAALGTLFVTLREEGTIIYKGTPEYRPGFYYSAGGMRGLPGVEPGGSVKALNALTGETRWEFPPARYPRSRCLRCRGRAPRPRSSFPPMCNSSVALRPIQHVRPHPRLKRFPLPRNRVPRDVEGVVPRIVSVRVRRMRAPRREAHRGNRPGRKDYRVRALAAEAVHNFFHRHDGPPRGQCGFLLHADNPLEQHIAPAVGLLRMHDGHVRPQRRHRSQFFAGERTAHETDVAVHPRQVRPAVSAKEGARQARRPGFIGMRHRAMAVLHNLQRPRPPALRGVAQQGEGPGSGIAAPRENQLPRRPHPDHLVVNQVGRHAD